MRKVILIVILLTVTACTEPPLKSQPLPKSLIDSPVKRDVPSSFFNGSAIVPVHESSQVVEVMNWFDDETVLFLQEGIEGSTLHKHHLFTGESSIFFEMEGWIVNVNVNVDHSLFAVHVINELDQSEIVIVDKQGENKLTIKDFGEEYSVYWNEYEPASFIMTAYLPDWDFETYFVNVEEERIKQVNLEQSYIQWISSDTVAYLKWDELEPSFRAPLYQANVETGETKLWKEDVIAYTSFPDGLSLSITVETDYDLYSVYKFYDNQERFRQIEVPILNTYSEQWWIPYYTYDNENGIFYFLRPKSSGDFISYTEGYDLIAYNVYADSETKLTTLDHHVPISISPGGASILIGDRFENVFDLSEGILSPVWEY
ncbi:hypothetical protein [Alkalihalobacillus deserti]|uniref:YqgU-like beta propeller domain-containing protein n=1 Tax=Alkalihalobacillus deserti TaxID=2879466 RepID=UPI001D1574EB|nr:hypothetical protein [Alkalihalobacillus deserti]